MEQETGGGQGVAKLDREVKGWSDFKFDKEDLIKQLYDETGVDYRT